MAINFLNNIASIGTLTITKATTDPLLYLYNTTNGGGATIRFSDQTTPSQVGDITYFHSDGSSQGGGASFHFISEPDTVLVVGSSTNNGRFVSKSAGSAGEVDYGFYDDVNTGMYRSAADTVRLAGGGVYNLSVSATNAALYYQSGLRFSTTDSGASVAGGLVIAGANDALLTINQTGTDTGWSYINFNTLGTRNYYVGQDSSKNFNIYNDNIDVVAISVSYTSNLTTIGGDLTVTGGDIVLSGTGRIQGIDTVSAGTDAANKTYVDAQVAARSTPATPSTITSTIVGETIEVAFNQSSTSNIDYYQVWSSDDGGDYGIIAQITPTDFSSTMTVVDTTFVTGGTMSYRVFAVREGIYSTAGTTSKAYTVSALSVTDMTVVNLNTAYYIQYEKPTSRFIDHVEIYMDSQTTSAALSRSNATIVYSGQNASYMRNVNTSSNFHQFWVEIVTS